MRMRYKRLYILLIIVLALATAVRAQSVVVAGTVSDEETKKPVEFATLLIKESGIWAISDESGKFQMKNVPMGRVVLTIQCLGYAKRELTIDITKDMPRMNIRLKQENLKLDEVTVTARRRTDEQTTSYSIDRTALDQQQILNIGDVTTLLPGGKSSNPSLMSDDRISLRSESTQEKGNASFGTAIEIDGVRLGNNSEAGESMAASTRSIGASNIESVEIVTGIPSVEFGDLSNGIVKVHTRKGKSPFIVEGKINQHTRQIALNKGFDLGKNRGVLNASVEHARSFKDAASPHTAYQRNLLSLNYMKILWSSTHPLTLNIGMTGNIGGYDSKTDPDNTLDSYAKTRDNRLTANMRAEWLLNKNWITNLSLQAAVTWQDKREEDYSNAASASAQPYIHIQEEGYHIAQDYDEILNSQFSALNSIILSPTGYWYVRQYNDQKPLNLSLKLKYDWARRFGKVLNKLMAGVDYTVSKNKGKGIYYEDMRYAPTWRPYRYDQLPALRNMALYVEDRITMSLPRGGRLQLTAGLRDDITHVSRSGYGTVGSLSPRFNSKYTLWSRRKQWVSELSLHAGWGKSVKLPSFQILYPAPSYSDMLVFTPGSTTDNRAYYAYYTYPAQTLHYDRLRWQYTNQTDIGVEATILGTRISLSAFHHKTYRPYMAVNHYTPFEYKTTSQQAIEGTAIPAADRQYAINQETGVVTLSDRQGIVAPTLLDYTARHTYNANRQYVNGTAVQRYGLEWTVDFARIKVLQTAIRIDGNYYYYKGTDETLFAANPAGIGEQSNPQYPLLGYYRGSSSTSTGTVASASLGNGSISRQLNLNATITTHIPKIRMIVALRIESSLYRYQRQLNELSGSTRAYAIEQITDYTGEPYNSGMRNTYVAVYPQYYATWDNPTELRPFLQDFMAAKDNDLALYAQLARLVVKSSYPYTFNPNRISSYYSANLSVTKEIGDHVSISFYANNFLNNMKTVHSSQTGLDTSLFGSGYIPEYYYGLSLKLKL